MSVYPTPVTSRERPLGPPRNRAEEPIGIIAALPEEARALRRRLVLHSRGRYGPFTISRGRVGGAAVVLAVGAEGPTRAAQCGRVLLEREAPGCLLIVGFSGGLSPGLAPGSVVVGTRIVFEGDDGAACDPGWSGQIASRSAARPARIVSSPRILWTASDKQRAWSGLSHDLPACVDLETAPIVAIAVEAGIPFAVLRVVSDPAEDSLPVDFNLFLDESGRLRRLGILGHVAVRPALIAPLWRLRRRARMCAERLADAVVASIEGDAP